MEGILLSNLRESLYPVTPELVKEPALSVPKLLSRIKQSAPDLQLSSDVYEYYQRLPLRAFGAISFDELCKLWYSTVFRMESSVERLFDTDSQYEVVQKIHSSLWRWSHFDGDWNQVATAHEGIRRFELAGLNSKYELRLDYTTGFNERGYSKFSRTFLDGVFAYLLYYQGKHVMTIGFSVVKGYRILITQLQLVEPKGNRFLFTFPKDPLEFIVACFQRAFPDHQIGVVDGNSLVDRILKDYKNGLIWARHWGEQYQESADRAEDESIRDGYLESVRNKEEECEYFLERISQLEDNRARLKNWYNSLNTFAVVEELEVAGMQFRLVA